MPQLERSLSNIEMGVEESLAKLESQSKNSKVCRDRNLISQVGNGNIESIQGMLLMKSKLAIAFAQGDGEINDEFVEKAGAIFALIKSK